MAGPALNNLPVQTTSFVGRLSELGSVVQAMRSSRLVTLTGPGGVGKTRLAIRAAEELLSDFPDGVWLVELSALRDPSEVAAATASALNLAEEPGRPPSETIADRLRRQHVLLVLDNCEHIARQAAELVRMLLEAGPELRVLATSREPLSIPGEKLWDVTPLGPQEACELFAERAARSRPGFRADGGTLADVEDICARVGSIPLALELAAAWVRALSCRQIAERLDALLSGDARLRSVADRSYELLSPGERVLFRRLAVFSSTFALDAAESVCAGDPLTPSDVLGPLMALIDRSLVAAEERAGDVRYHLLATLKDYAADKLSAAGEADAAQARHAEWCLGLAEESDVRLRGHRQAAWLELLDAHHEDLRAALDRLFERDEDAGVRLASGLWPFWELRGRLTEGRRWLERALAASGSADPRVLVGAAALAQAQGDYDRSREWAAQALRTSRESKDARSASVSLRELGRVAYRRGEYDEADALYRESVEAYEDPWAINGLGMVAQARGDYPRAAGLFRRSLEGFRASGDEAAAAVVLVGIGSVFMEQGEYGDARAYFEESLVLTKGLGDRAGVARVLYNLGHLSQLQGDLDEARSRQEEALDIARAIGDAARVGAVLGDLGNIARLRGEYGAARGRLEESIAVRRRIGDRWALATSIEQLGHVRFAEGHYPGARELYEQALAICRELGDPWGTADALLALGGVSAVEGDTATSASQLEEALALYRSIGQRWGEASSLSKLAGVAGGEWA